MRRRCVHQAVLSLLLFFMAIATVWAPIGVTAPVEEYLLFVLTTDFDASLFVQQLEELRLLSGEWQEVLQLPRLVGAW